MSQSIPSGGTGRAGRTVFLVGLSIAAAAPVAAGQVGTPSPGASLPSGSLVVDPQQGATPRPLPPVSTPLPPSSPEPVTSTATPQGPVLPAPITVGPTRSVSGSVAPAAPLPFVRRQRDGALPIPTGDPLRIDPTNDPVLRLARTTIAPEPFNAAIADAVRRNPAIDEAAAQVEEADAARDEAQARRLPTLDASVSSFRVISRAFSNDPGNVLERSRPNRRTDGLLRLQQPVLDWGSGLSRVRSARARLNAARANVEDTGTQVALRAISSWYQVYGYRVLVRLAESFTANQRDLRTALQDRVRQGAAAPADVAQVDGYIASADAQTADFRRLLAGAEAQYTALVGTAPPPGLGRAPVPPLDGIGAGSIAGDVDQLPAVRGARLAAEAARLDARALKSDRLPQVTAGVDAGRYGVFETARDYDIRGNLTMSVRLGGGAAERVRQAKARANGADARLNRARVEATRDAEIALADVTALEAAREAIEANYIASRQSRDVLVERFRVSRGTLVDVVNAESNYFAIAARYVQTVIELDSARYALLARTGRLLPALDIAPATLDPR
ncbi:hypothetical protein ASE86_14945 [Sphingomonas sp. Leaf33]|uniref:TolC family protein n=1 Tax=Sphingomonas sp. Leaf33 TaxID=1736215 RepID=UPI0006FE129B|nr:TolC family protein [Sphingomonas sp. Leaf33]KQN21258.1 hypothetical protein ASE86_14945 [Sphingomonas sp. Leaf33]